LRNWSKYVSNGVRVRPRVHRSTDELPAVIDRDGLRRLSANSLLAARQGALLSWDFDPVTAAVLGEPVTLASVAAAEWRAGALDLTSQEHSYLLSASSADGKVSIT
jgi:hypothetical protein